MNIKASYNLYNLIESRFFSHGICVLPGSPHRSCINRATIFQPWKCWIYVDEQGPIWSLQWGHDFSTVEIKSQWRHPLSDGHASMGPRFFNRGNQVTRTRSCSGSFHQASMGPRFFNRGNTAPGPIVTAPVGVLLQWGHDFSAVEMMEAGSKGKPRTVTGFNGATTFQPWKFPLYVFSPAPTFKASMGPRLFSRGNFQAIGLRCGSYKLQWGHDFSAVEM